MPSLGEPSLWEPSLEGVSLEELSPGELSASLELSPSAPASDDDSPAGSLAEGVGAVGVDGTEGVDGVVGVEGDGVEGAGVEGAGVEGVGRLGVDVCEEAQPATRTSISNGMKSVCLISPTILTGGVGAPVLAFLLQPER